MVYSISMRFAKSKLTLLLIFAFGFMVSSSALAEECTDVLKGLFAIESFKGKTLTPRETQKLTPYLPYSFTENRVEFLGAGAGGEVYRITPLSSAKPAFVVKLTDPTHAANDSSAFEIIQTALSNSTDLKVVKNKIIPSAPSNSSSFYTPILMEVESIEGRSLYSMFADPEVPLAVKNELRKKYDRSLNKVKESLQNQYSVRGEVFESIPQYFDRKVISEWKHLPDQGIGAQPMIGRWTLSPKRYDPKLKLAKNIEIMIKSDNIIVTPDYQFYLIDPH